MSFNFLKTAISDGVLTVTLNRPPVNAVNQQMYKEIHRLFSNPDQVGAGVRAIVLHGAGPHFCAGHELEDFRKMTPETGTEEMWRVREAFTAIAECAVPVIGAVHGAALGTGIGIAASCDFLMAAENAYFGLPELTIGVMGGARHLARLVPQPVVRRMFFTGEPLSAREFANAGAPLVICANDELLTTARRFAVRIASLSPTAMRLGKQVLNRIEWMDLRSGYEFEQGFTVRMSGHPDSKEALAAFREKRPARYLEVDGRWSIET